MSDVSGIPNMGFGGGNFFAPSFSYNPQMSAGQIQSNYMPEFYNNQNVLGNLYGGGSNAGFGQLTSYYSQLAANQLSGIGSAKPIGFYDNSVVGPYGGNIGISPEQRFQTNSGGYSFPSIPDFSGGLGGGGGGNAPAINWNTIFQSSGGGLGGSPNLGLSDVQSWAGNWNMPQSSAFDLSGSGGMFGGLGGGAGAYQGPNNAMDWTHLFGGGGAQQRPQQLQQPAELDAPMPGAPSSTADWTKLFDGGARAGDLGTAPAAVPSSDRLLGYTPQEWPQNQPQNPFDTGASPLQGTANAGPYGGGLGMGGLGWGDMSGQPYTAPVTPPDTPAMLGTPVTEAYNPYFDVTSPSSQRSGGTVAGSSEGGGLTAADLGDQARTKLAELMNKDRPVEMSVAPSEGTGRTAESAREAGGPVTSDAATGNVPLPRARPEGADAPRPPETVPPAAPPIEPPAPLPEGASRPPARVRFTVEPGKEERVAGVNPRLRTAVEGGAQFLPPGYSVEVFSGVRYPEPGKPQAFHRIIDGSGRAMDVRIIGPDGPITPEGNDYTGMYTLLARGVKTWAAQNDPGSVSGYGGAFATSKGSGKPDLMHFDQGPNRGSLRPDVQYNTLKPLSEVERNAMPAYIPMLGENQVPLDRPVPLGAGYSAPVPPLTDRALPTVGPYRASGMSARDFAAPASVMPPGAAGAIAPDGTGTVSPNYWNVPKPGTPEWQNEVYEPNQGGFIMRRNESGTGGRWQDFARTGNIEDRRGEYLTPEQRAALPPVGYQALPEVAPTPLSGALGLGDLPVPKAGMTAGTIRPQGITGTGFEGGATMPSMQDLLGYTPQQWPDSAYPQSTPDAADLPRSTPDTADLPRSTSQPAEQGSLMSEDMRQILGELAQNAFPGEAGRGGYLNNPLDAAAPTRADLAAAVSASNNGSSRYSDEGYGTSTGRSPPVTLSPEHMRTMEEIESHQNPRLHDPGSSYKGLYQLSDREFRKYGGTGSIFNAEQNTKAATAKMYAEGQRAQDILGRALTPVEQYMVHQQGLAGTLSHLAHPDQPAWKSWQQAASSSEAKAKEAIWGNLSDAQKDQFGSVNNITSRDFINLWNTMYYQKMVESGLSPGGLSELPQ